MLNKQASEKLKIKSEMALLRQKVKKAEEEKLKAKEEAKAEAREEAEKAEKLRAALEKYFMIILSNIERK